MNKSEIRSLGKQLREALSAGRRSKAENIITNKLMEELRAHVAKHNASHPFTLALYSAFASELSLCKFVEAISQELPRIRLCFPAMVCDDAEESAGSSHMEFRAVPGSCAASSSAPKFLADPVYAYDPNDPELCEFAMVMPQEIDFMVVPVVAFDDSGTRLGYGGGNYDRYLPMLRSSARVVGAAFAVQKVAAIPQEAHDIVIDRIIYA